MASTFFFQSTSGGTAISPSVHANWDLTNANFARYVLNTTGAKLNTAMTDLTDTVTGSLSEYCRLQYVSPALGAQTISGTIDIGIMNRVSATGAVFFAYNIWVATPAGAVRGVLLDMTANTGNAINSSVNFTPDFDGAQAIASLAVSDGDYLIVELGYDVNNTSSKTVETKVGDANANGNVTVDTTTTTVVDGIITFSATITFSSGSKQLMMVGCGT